MYGLPVIDGEESLGGCANFETMAEGLLEDRKDGTVLKVDVKPGAGQFRIGEVNPWRNNLKISVSAPAMRGKANGELLEKLESILERKVRIVAGFKSSEKKVLVKDASRAEVKNCLDL